MSDAETSVEDHEDALAERDEDEDRRQAVCGIFWLLQHGERELKSRADQAAVFTEFLSKHTFYSDDHTTVYNADSFRDLAYTIAKEARCAWGNSGHDRVDQLCRYRLERVPRDLLKSYGYNPATFSEADLPAFEAPADVSMDAGTFAKAELPIAEPPADGSMADADETDEASDVSVWESRQRKPKEPALGPHTQRAVYLVLRDVDAVTTMHAHPDYKYRSERHIPQALDMLIAMYNLQQESTAVGATHPFTSAKLSSAIDTVCRKHPQPATPRHLRHRTSVDSTPRTALQSVWVAGTKAVRLDRVRRLQKTAEDLKKKFDASLYNEDATVRLSKEVAMWLGGGVTPGSAVTATANVTITSPPGTHLPWLSQVLGNPSEGLTESIEVRSRQCDDHGYKASPEVHITPSVGEVSSGDGHVLLRAVPSADLQVCQSRETMYDETVVRGDQHQAYHVPVSAPVHDTSLGVSNHQKPFVGSPAAMPALFDAGDLEKRMRAMQESMQKAVNRLVITLKLESADSPFVWQAKGDLAALYKRCWGPAWVNTVDLLQRSRSILASDALLSLLACSIHYDIFEPTGPSFNQFLLESVLFHKFFGQTLDPDMMAHIAGELVATTRRQATPNTVMALQQLVDRPQLLEDLVHRYSIQQADSLLFVLEPHLRRLHDVSRATYYHDKEERWRETFRSDVQDVMKQALMLKLHLVNAQRLGHKHYFDWATHGMTIDTEHMRVKNAPSPPGNYQVAFCLASGVLVQISGGVEDRVTALEVVAQSSRPQF
ncbi:hypothetical protein LTR17_012691 [Elasticomyces elasticus]|nr:hypothetical protein LTR17_012691 [Elasticomyces elasticus]